MNKGSLCFGEDVETIFTHVLVGIAPKAIGRGKMICVIVQNPLFYADGTENTGEIFVGSGSNYIYSMIPGQESPHLYAEDQKDVYIKLKFPTPNPNGAIATFSIEEGGVDYNPGDIVFIESPIGTNASIEVDTVDDSIVTLEIEAAGTGYLVGDILTLTNGDSTATIEVDTIGGAGEILTFTLLTDGDGYSTGVSPTTGGAGADATFNVTEVLGAIVTATLVTGGSGFTAGEEATGIPTVRGLVINVLTLAASTPETADVNLLIYRKREGGKQ